MKLINFNLFDVEFVFFVCLRLKIGFIMKFYCFLLTLSCCFAFAQGPKLIEEYSYGINGIEFFENSSSGKTVIVSSFNARPTIKKEVAKKILNYFKEINPKNNDVVQIIADDAIVNGVLYIKTTGNLTSLEFHYQTVDWNSGLTEVYKKPIPKSKKRKA